MLTPKQERNCWVSEGAARSYRKIFEKVKFWLIISKELLTVLYISCGKVSEVISLGIQLARVDNPQDDLGIILHLWSGTGPKTNKGFLTLPNSLTVSKSNSFW